MTLEQQVASLVTATTELTGVVNAELNKVRSENTSFQSTVVLKSGSIMSGDITVPKIHITDVSTNTSFGLNSGENISPNGIRGIRNVAVGYNSLSLLDSGSLNTAIGGNSLVNLKSGEANTAVGQGSLQSCISGTSNTSIGNGALYSCLGDNNTAIGQGSLSGLVDFFNCTGIGMGSFVTGSNQIQLGNENSNVYAYGTVQNRSDSRDKTNIRPTILGLSFIKSIRPVDYCWDLRDSYRLPMPLAKINPSNEEKALYNIELKKWQEDSKLSNLTHNGSKKGKRYHHGIIAQELQELIRTTGVDFGGFQDHKIAGGDDILSIGYSEFIAPLIKAVQELSDMNDALKERVKTLEAKVT
jgi:trimeric autotransporter adhesin